MKKRLSSMRTKAYPVEPKVLKEIGEDSKRHGTDALTERQIEQLIQKVGKRRKAH